MVTANKTDLQLSFYRSLVAPKRVLEVGVQGGGSLALWQELWPHALVVGVDVDPDATWPPGCVRIEADQSDPDLPARITSAVGPSQFDLVIDDASHLVDASFSTWSRLWPLTADTYVWEDWGTGVLAPEHWGDPSRLLLTMAAEVEHHRAEYFHVLPGMAILRR